MLLFLFHEGMETSPEDSCLQLSSQGAKKTSSISQCVRRGWPCPGELQGRRQCYSAVTLVHYCEQSLTEHGAAAADGADFMTCSTSALLLVAPAPLYNTCEVWTTIGKWQNFALTPFSISAGSNPDFQESVLLAKLETSYGEAQSASGVQYPPLMATVYKGEGNPAFYLLLLRWWIYFPYMSIFNDYWMKNIQFWEQHRTPRLYLFRSVP